MGSCDSHRALTGRAGIACGIQAAHDPKDPRISPVFGDFQGLPPMLVHVGDQEIVRGQLAQPAT